MSDRSTRGHARHPAWAVGLAVALAGCAQGNLDDDASTAAPKDDAAVVGADVARVDAGAAPADAARTDAPTPAMDVRAAPTDVPASVDVPRVNDTGTPAPDVAAGSDGVIDRSAGEVCDDGNRADGDACAADCRRVLCEDGSWRTVDPATARCYWRDTNVALRNDANARCTARGGRLAVFETAAEMAVVFPAVGLRGTSSVWIGLRRMGSGWAWDDGTSLSYTGFRSGEPAGDGDCAEWGPTNDFNDLPCDLRRDVLCERAPPGRVR